MKFEPSCDASRSNRGPFIPSVPLAPLGGDRENTTEPLPNVNGNGVVRRRARAR
jgi:hypothetical protein